MQRLTERNINMDIMRILALLLVVSVHFFLWNGFYHMNMNSPEAFILCVFRTISMSCVPLFLMISGALLSKRNLLPVNRKYLKKPGELLLIYFMCTLILIFFRGVLLKEPMDLWDVMENIFSFSQYSWYVFMYVGLFVLIPYLNLIWNRLNEHRDKITMIVVLCVLAALTSVVNIRKTIIPETWTGIYPVTYYFLGALISEEYEKIKTKRVILFTIWFFFALLFGMINYVISRKEVFSMGAWNDWGSVENIVLSSIVFVLILKLDTGNMKTGLKKKLMGMSNLVYPAFLLSYISDIVVWKAFKGIISVNNMLLIYIPAVLLSFVLAMLMSWIFNFFYVIIKKRVVRTDRV